MDAWTSTRVCAIETLRCLLLVVLVLLAACDSAVPEPPDQEPEPPVERSYTQSITRSFSNAFEEALLHEAEAVYPPRDSVVAAAPSWCRELIPPEKYWWYCHFDNVLLPYAITGDAVAYYSGLIDALETALEAGQPHQFLITASLEYRAEVSFEASYTVESSPRHPVEEESFEQVYVVAMHLEWDQDCGFLCAMGFSAKRVVVFDEDGELLKVFFDTKHPAWAS